LCGYNDAHPPELFQVALRLPTLIKTPFSSLNRCHANPGTNWGISTLKQPEAASRETVKGGGRKHQQNNERHLHALYCFPA